MNNIQRVSISDTLKAKALLIATLSMISMAVLAEQTPLRFVHIGAGKGLAQSPVTALLQDYQGFAWLGNWKGLSRYDGYSFKEFRYDEGKENSISNGRINVLFEDSRRRLWIGTANGLNLYNRKTETFDYYGAPSLKGGLNYISGIAEDSKGDIWVGTFGGLCRMDSMQRKLKLIAFQSQAVHSLIKTQDGSIWLGLQRGISRFDTRSRRPVDIPAALKENQAFQEAKMLVIRQDLIGNLWFGSEESGLFHFVGETGSLKHYTYGEMPSNWIKGILPRKNGEVWVATRNGLSIYQPKDEKFTTHYHEADDTFSLTDNSLWSLMEDENQVVWLGSFSGKLSLYSPSNANFSTIGQQSASGKGLSNPIAHYFVAESPDSIWIATFGGGVNRWVRTSNELKQFRLNDSPADQASNHVKTMALDRSGKLWLGTLRGLYTLDIKTFHKEYHPLGKNDGKLSASLINTLLVQGDTVWAGSNGGGLYQILPDGRQNLYRKEEGGISLSDNFVNTLLPDGGSGLWIGTQSGLNYFDTQQQQVTRIFKKRDQPYALTSNDVTTLFRDSRQRLWVGTEKGSLFYFEEKRNRFHKVDQSLGLTDNFIRAIREDASNHLWVSTDNGLFKLDFLRFQLPFRPEDISVTHYRSSQGLPGNMFMSNAALALADKSVIFGSMEGLTHFHPQHLHVENKPPRLALTAFLVKNQPVAIASGIKGALEQSISTSSALSLQHDQGFFSISYAALNFINAEHNAYAVKMEGLPDDDWHYVGNQRTATYTNLSPGNYTFLVKAANSDGIWSEALALGIAIHPPLWATWWAFTLYAVSALGMISYGLFFIRSRELLKRDLHHEQLKMDFFTKVSHEIRIPVTLIAVPLSRLIEKNDGNEALQQQLKQIRSQSERLNKLVSELLDFRKIESGNLQLFFSRTDINGLLKKIFSDFRELAELKEIDYRFEEELGQVAQAVDADQLEKVLVNLLSNAFKFTPEGGRIWLRLRKADKKEGAGLIIVVENTGPEIPKAFHRRIFDPFVQAGPQDYRAGTGIGLALAKQVIEKHGGNVDVYSSEKRTSFSVFLPALEETVSPVTNTTGSQELANKTGVLESHRFPGGRILIAEDNPELQAVLKDLFSDDYQLTVCGDGEQAWEAVLRFAPDLIISDVMMPRVSGLQLCRQVKQDERTSHIPVMLLTAKAAPEDHMAGIAWGADYYFTKPFNPQLLLLQVINILSAARLLREKFSRIIRLQPYNTEIDSPQEQLLNRLMAIIQEHIEDPSFGVPELASAAGISKTVLYGKVQSMTQLSVATFIKSVRLQQAALLLRDSQYNVAEVAFAVGFTDRKYFSKEFKKQFDLTPSDYQKNPANPV